jgi:hypothetical protein
VHWLCWVVVLVQAAWTECGLFARPCSCCTNMAGVTSDMLNSDQKVPSYD